MQVVGSFTGSFQATGNGNWTAIGTQQPLEIPANGYLAVYLDNASLGDVFFDQLQVRFTRGNLKEETHYYPFGLPMGDIGSTAVGFTLNRRKYQSNEYIKDAGLKWMSFHARQFDPQIGRFMGVDPLAASGGQDRLSPYAAMGDEPAGVVDPGGMRMEPPRVSEMLLPIIKFAFMSPTMRAMAGGGRLIWLPLGDGKAAFGQAGMSFYDQSNIGNQNETMGNNGNNSGDGSLVNNGADFDPNCYSMDIVTPLPEIKVSAGYVNYYNWGLEAAKDLGYFPFADPLKAKSMGNTYIGTPAALLFQNSFYRAAMKGMTPYVPPSAGLLGLSAAVHIPIMMGVSLDYTANLGIVNGEFGFFQSLTPSASVDMEPGISLNGFTGFYHGQGMPTLESLKGWGEGYNANLGYINIGYSGGFNKNTTIWNVYSVGASTPAIGFSYSPYIYTW